MLHIKEDEIRNIDILFSLGGHFCEFGAEISLFCPLRFKDFNWNDWKSISFTFRQTYVTISVILAHILEDKMRKIDNFVFSRGSFLWIWSWNFTILSPSFQRFQFKWLKMYFIYLQTNLCNHIRHFRLYSRWWYEKKWRFRFLRGSF